VAIISIIGIIVTFSGNLRIGTNYVDVYSVLTAESIRSYDPPFYAREWERLKKRGEAFDLSIYEYVQHDQSVFYRAWEPVSWSEN
jgi:hypothetical protein